MALEEAGHSRGIGAPPAALRGDAERVGEAAGGVDAGAVAVAIVVVDQSQVQDGVGEALEIDERPEVVRIGPLLRNRKMEEIDATAETAADAVGDLYHDGGVARHD